jgi:hypothetical protein
MGYTLEEYHRGLAAIEEEAKQKKVALVKEFAMANNPHKKGDTIRDSEGGLIIERINIHYGYGNSLPYCSYGGTELKKDGTPKLRQSKRTIAQFNIIE